MKYLYAVCKYFISGTWILLISLLKLLAGFHCCLLETNLHVLELSGSGVRIFCWAETVHYSSK